MEKKIIINIGRQFGGGGLAVAGELGKKLGIPVYDRELIHKAAQDSGFSAELFEQSDEKRRIFSLSSIFTSIYTSPTENYMSDSGLFEIQCSTIQKIAQQGSAIIVGRCADYVLKDYPNVMSVFVHADEDFCFDRAMERNSMTPKEMKKFIAKVDKYRGDYYRYYTGRNWTDARNYDLCLDCGKLGFDKCMEEILAYRKVRFGV